MSCGTASIGFIVGSNARSSVMLKFWFPALVCHALPAPIGPLAKMGSSSIPRFDRERVAATDQRRRVELALLVGERRKIGSAVEANQLRRIPIQPEGVRSTFSAVALPPAVESV
jgi:hypothetical protein